MSMAIEFAPAVRSAEKARIAVAGPAGSGKTYTALAIATYLSPEPMTVAVVDTERGSASKYQGVNGWQFESHRPTSYSPEDLPDVLSVAAGRGFAVVIVDSLSHYWMGSDGMLEQVDRRTRGNSSFNSGWKDMRPVERRMIDALLSYPGHVIVTLRTKSEWVIEKDDKTGKSKPTRIGLKPEQREGLEYEFDVMGELDLANTLTISKTRVPGLHGAVIDKPGAPLAETIRDWLADGEELPGPMEYRARLLNLTARTQVADLRSEVATVGLLNAPVVDADGKPVLLGALIDRRLAEPLPADVARDELRALAGQHGWNTRQISDAYRAAHDSTELKAETDPDKIRAFTADLAAAPEQGLALAGGTPT